VPISTLPHQKNATLERVAVAQPRLRMGSSAKWYCVLGAGSVTGMFCVRELLQRGGNVRACCRDPDKWRADIESLVAYFPRGKRGVLEFVAADVTKAETLGPALQGCEAVIFTASGSAWSGPGGSYDVDYKARACVCLPFPASYSRQSS